MARQGQAPEHDELADALAFIMDGEPLTTTGQWRGAFERRRENRALLVERACWLRSEGMSFYAIARELRCASITAKKYVAAAAPELLNVSRPRGGGPPPGKYGKLSDDKLRALHRLHITLDVPASELGRRLAGQAGYASSQSARVAILQGWRRLGLRAQAKMWDSPRHCVARRRDRTRCTRWAMIGSEVCAAHRNVSLTAGNEAA